MNAEEGMAATARHGDMFTPRSDWSREQIRALFDMPFMDLLYRAHSVHRHWFDPNQIQISTLLSIKTGSCPEDCGYCPQSAHHNASLEKEALLALDEVVAAAKRAKDLGATRFCMGAAWRSPNRRDFPKVLAIVEAVRDIGMQTCMTLGMLDQDQATALQQAGLDYYNHNLDTSPEHYPSIISTRTYQDRLDTLAHVREAGISVCSGGIVGMGEDDEDRVGLLHQLASLPKHPESVPINNLVRVEGTPLADGEDLDEIEFVRMVAVARCVMPASVVRLSAGRSEMSKAMQSLCFFAGANSLFYGEKLLTTPNPDADADRALLTQLGLKSWREPLSQPV